MTYFFVEYDIQTLDLILRISGYLKEKYNISYTEPGNEGINWGWKCIIIKIIGIVYERIFAHAVNLVEENNQSYPVISLASIINHYRNNQSKLPYVCSTSSSRASHSLKNIVLDLPIFFCAFSYVSKGTQMSAVNSFWKFQKKKIAFHFWYSNR